MTVDALCNAPSHLLSVDLKAFSCSYRYNERPFTILFNVVSKILLLFFFLSGLEICFLCQDEMAFSARRNLNSVQKDFRWIKDFNHFFMARLFSFKFTEVYVTCQIHSAKNVPLYLNRMCDNCTYANILVSIHNFYIRTHYYYGINNQSVNDSSFSVLFKETTEMPEWSSD